MNNFTLSEKIVRQIMENTYGRNVKLVAKHRGEELAEIYFNSIRLTIGENTTVELMAGDEVLAVCDFPKMDRNDEIRLFGFYAKMGIKVKQT